jgi:hypothetical protein
MRRGGIGGGAEGGLKKGSLLGQPVNGGAGGAVIAIAGEVVRPQGINDDKQDIGGRLGRLEASQR